MIYGYARVSTKKQELQRQINAISSRYPDVVLFQEKYTGTTTDRPEWKKLCNMVKAGDTIVFESVSRMSRNAEEGFSEYQRLFDAGVSLEFISDSHVNTSVYKSSIESRLSEITVNTGEDYCDEFINTIMKALHKFSMDIAKKHIRIAFEHSEQEVQEKKRTTIQGQIAAGAYNEYDEEGNVIKQGSISLGLTGKQYKVKNKDRAKDIIRKHSKNFGGSLNDLECMKLAGVSNGTFYKYVKEMLAE